VAKGRPEVDRIALDIHGGRKEGYRAWTHKQNFPPNPVGKWQVRVLTEDGQVIGVLRFKVTTTHRRSGKAVRANTGIINKQPMPAAL
jgi:hypothetical protein